MLVAVDALTKKVDAEPLKDRLATTTAGVPNPGGAGLLRRRLRVQEEVQGADGFLGHRDAGDQEGPRLLIRTIT